MREFRIFYFLVDFVDLPWLGPNCEAALMRSLLAVKSSFTFKCYLEVHVFHDDCSASR